MDSNGNPSSGSMKVTLNFDSGTLGGNNKGAYTRDAFFPGVDGSQFSSLQFDLKIDSGSVTDAFGNNGFFSLALRNTDNYNYVQQFGDNVRSADGWRHIVVSPHAARARDHRVRDFEHLLRGHVLPRGENHRGLRTAVE